MAKMMRENFRLIGRCHPWCGNREYIHGRAAEKRAANEEIRAGIHDIAVDWAEYLETDEVGWIPGWNTIRR